MLKKPLALSCFALLMFLISANETAAQKTAAYTDNRAGFKKATEFFEKQKYGLTKYFFDSYSKEYADEFNLTNQDADYYSAIASVELFHQNAEYTMNTFLQTWPESARRKDAYYQMGKFQYREKCFKKAAGWFEQIDPYYLTEDEKAEYNFKLGYCYFVMKETDKAEKCFYEIKDINTKYTIPAIYFYSHIAYEKRNFETALQGFNRLSNDESFGPIVPYYITQLYYLQDKYEQVIEYAPALLDSANTRRGPEIARIIGESYYRTKKYSEAIPYLEVYREKSKNFTREDQYELGYAYYKVGDYAKSVQCFEVLTNVKDSLSQNALYLMADCYLKAGRKNDARMALGSASSMEFDQRIREESMFNYAKLTYELSYSPFNEAITTLQQFIKLFPNSPLLDDVYGYLGKVYMTTRNYASAIDVLENIQNITAETEEAYQRVTFFRAVELFNSLDFPNAIIHFDKSLNNAKYNEVYRAQAIFWKAEAYYRLNRYDDAIALYNKFLLTQGAFGTREFNLAYYSLGYAAYKKSDYKQALGWFRKYVDNNPGLKSRVMADALNRTGDCYLVARDYESAADVYGRAMEIKGDNADYAMFQKGFCEGLLKKHNDKIVTMLDLASAYPNSAYLDDALFETGMSYVAIEEFGMAITSFQNLITDYPASSYVKKSYLQLGMVYYNTDKNDLSLEAYKKVAEGYPGTAEAKDAANGIKTVYLDMNQVEVYYEWVKTQSGQIDVTVTEEDSLMYASAEKVYMSNDCDKALELFGKYIQKFGETGIFSSNVFYYKAECEMKKDDKANALLDYKKVLARRKGIFTEPALSKAARLSYENADYQTALIYYTELLASGEYENNRIIAKVGIMRCHFYLNDMERASTAAVEVLNAGKISDELNREAHFIMGKSFYTLGDVESALEEFRIISKTCKSKEEAESKYLIAEILFKQQKYDEAEAEVFDFVKKNTPQQFWLGKSFLLLSDVYVAKQDDFQATATLQSIIDNYKPKDDGTVAEAEKKLNEIRERQKKAEEEKNILIQDIDMSGEGEGELVNPEVAPIENQE